MRIHLLVTLVTWCFTSRDVSAKPVGVDDTLLDIVSKALDGGSNKDKADSISLVLELLAQIDLPSLCQAITSDSADITQVDDIIARAASSFDVMPSDVKDRLKGDIKDMKQRTENKTVSSEVFRSNEVTDDKQSTAQMIQADASSQENQVSQVHAVSQESSVFQRGPPSSNFEDSQPSNEFKESQPNSVSQENPADDMVRDSQPNHMFPEDIQNMVDSYNYLTDMDSLPQGYSEDALYNDLLYPRDQIYDYYDIDDNLMYGVVAAAAAAAAGPKGDNKNLWFDPKGDNKDLWLDVKGDDKNFWLDSKDKDAAALFFPEGLLAFSSMASGRGAGQDEVVISGSESLKPDLALFAENLKLEYEDIINNNNNNENITTISAANNRNENKTEVSNTNVKDAVTTARMEATTFTSDNTDTATNSEETTTQAVDDFFTTLANILFSSTDDYTDYEEQNNSVDETVSSVDTTTQESLQTTYGSPATTNSSDTSSNGTSSNSSFVSSSMSTESVATTTESASTVTYGLNKSTQDKKDTEDKKQDKKIPHPYLIETEDGQVKSIADPSKKKPQAEVFSNLKIDLVNNADAIENKTSAVSFSTTSANSATISNTTSDEPTSEPTSFEISSAAATTTTATTESSTTSSSATNTSNSTTMVDVSTYATTPENETSATTSVSSTTDVSSNTSTTLSANGSTTVSANESTTLSINESTTVSANEPTTLSINESTTVSANEPTTLSINESTTVSANESTTLSINESTTLSINESTTLSINESTTHSINESATLSSNASLTVSTNASTIAVFETTTQGGEEYLTRVDDGKTNTRSELSDNTTATSTVATTGASSNTTSVEPSTAAPLHAMTNATLMTSSIQMSNTSEEPLPSDETISTNVTASTNTTDAASSVSVSAVTSPQSTTAAENATTIQTITSALPTANTAEDNEFPAKRVWTVDSPNYIQPEEQQQKSDVKAEQSRYSEEEKSEKAKQKAQFYKEKASSVSRAASKARRQPSEPFSRSAFSQWKGLEVQDKWSMVGRKQDEAAWAQAASKLGADGRGFYRENHPRYRVHGHKIDLSEEHVPQNWKEYLNTKHIGASTDTKHAVTSSHTEHTGTIEDNKHPGALEDTRQSGTSADIKNAGAIVNNNREFSTYAIESAATYSSQHIPKQHAGGQDVSGAHPAMNYDSVSHQWSPLGPRFVVPNLGTLWGINPNPAWQKTNNLPKPNDQSDSAPVGYSFPFGMKLGPKGHHQGENDVSTLVTDERPKVSEEDLSNLGVHQKTIMSEAASASKVPRYNGYTCPGLFGYFGDVMDCRSFFICSWGVPYRFYCPSGLMWNPAENVCDWSRNVRCSHN